jgi:hypothetical protein
MNIYGINFCHARVGLSLKSEISLFTRLNLLAVRTIRSLAQELSILLRSPMGLSIIGIMSASSIMYFVYRVLYIPYRYPEKALPSDLKCPYSHHGSAGFSLDQKKVKQLSLLSNLQQKDYFYHGDLSTEQNEVAKRMKDAALAELFSYIEQTRNIVNRQVALDALFVVMGIKPALVDPIKTFPKLHAILKNMASESLILKDSEEYFYFVNEKPLPMFDPRRFLILQEGISLADATMESFTSIGKLCHHEQRLSYLLGYGPTWEAYAVNVGALKIQGNFSSTGDCCFAKEHYEQMGQVFLKELCPDSSDEAYTLGLAYHLNFASLIQSYQRDYEVQYEHYRMGEYIMKVGFFPVISGISVRTEYCRKRVSLTHWIVETYFAKLPHPILNTLGSSVEFA